MTTYSSFINSIYNHPSFSRKIKNVVAVEKNKKELKKIQPHNKSYKGIHVDFLEYQENNNQKFSLVLGNPPYIKKGLLTKKQIEYCKQIHEEASLADTRPKNIWTAFLVRCIKFTSKDGILALVLPSELLQVKFASELRELILKEFERVEIFTFNELLFKDCKNQDTLLLICERKSEAQGVFYCNIDKSSDLEKGEFALAQNIHIRESKWTHNHLTTEEIELLEKLKKQLKIVNDYCDSRAGIVTAANDYFIVNSEILKEFSLKRFVKPIIQKGFFVNGSVIVTEGDIEQLIFKSKPSFLIDFSKRKSVEGNKKVEDYLKIGIEREIDKRYKTSIRENWYEVPNVGTPPQGFFFKRCHEYPKMIRNDANVLVTDSAYKITMNKGLEMKDLIYSFYNSLTLSFAELHGRYYGGGVLELTPNEFKNLPVPYLTIGKRDFNSYVKEFKSKTSIKEVCKKNDASILKSIDAQLDDDSIIKLFNIREKLYTRRIKTN